MNSVSFLKIPEEIYRSFGEFAMKRFFVEGRELDGVWTGVPRHVEIFAASGQLWCEVESSCHRTSGSIRHPLLCRCQKEKHHQPYDLPVPLHIKYAM